MTTEYYERCDVCQTLGQKGDRLYLPSGRYRLYFGNTEALALCSPTCVGAAIATDIRRRQQPPPLSFWQKVRYYLTS